MDQKSSKKILTISFLLAGALAAFVINTLIETFRPLTSGSVLLTLESDFVRHVLPVIVGFITFLVLQLNKKVLAWGEEVVTEISKVVWPSRKDTVAMTIVVTIMVTISALIISVFDFLSSQLINYIVSL